MPPAGHGKMPRSIESLQAQGAISSSDSTQSGGTGLGQTVVQHHQLLRPKVPRYRGLVWVVCEEDVRGRGDKVTLSIRGVNGMDLESDDDDGSLYDETSESSWEEDESDLELGEADDERDVVVVVDQDDDSQGIPSTKGKDELTKDEMDAMPYMHPVISPHSHHHANLASINTSFSESSTDLETATSSSTSISSTPSADASTAPTSMSGSPVSASPDGGCATAYPQVIALEEVEAPPSTAQLKSVEQREEVNGNRQKKQDKESLKVASPVNEAVSGSKHKTRAKANTDPAAPPLMTCTFRPNELLRKRRVNKPPSAAMRENSVAGDKRNRNPRKGAEHRAVDDEETDTEVVWEFVPARVPDGISLRNFGIQMPIYATISDIVVYSPSGPTKATIALAERFRQAIARKRKERIDALKGVVYSQQHHGPGAPNSGIGHFIRIEDVLKAEKEKREVVRAERKREREKEKAKEKSSAPTPAPIDSSATASSDGPVNTPSSPSPSDSDSDSSYSYTSDIDDDDEEDLETRMFDTAERYLLSLVEDDLLDYNVFVLDGTEEDMRKLPTTNPAQGGMAHLMMRSCGSGVPGGEDHGRTGIVPNGSPKKPTPATGPHTIGSDGELQGEKEIERRAALNHSLRASVERMDVDGDVTPMDMDVGMPAGDMDMETLGDVDMVAVGGKLAECSQDDEDEEDAILIPNTVDFALREKEEMRDLTKASEIISLFPSTKYGDRSSPPGSATGNRWSASPAPLSNRLQDPPHLQHLSKLIPPPSPGRTVFGPQESVEFAFTHPDTSVDISSPATFFDPVVGQVFLGNSGDVPLAANVKDGVSVTASGKVRRVLGPGDLNEEEGNVDENDETLSPDDPFSFAATNDPALGLGYDICIECHELAPFPTPAHVRAAEEHLSVLEVMWRTRCVDREKARRRRAAQEARGTEGDHNEVDDEGEDEDTTPILVPPRPPPHANAVIHLPFPSSPPNTQQTMGQLMPVMRFLEKWIRPVPGEVKVEVEIKVKKKDTTPTPASEKASTTQQPQQNSSGVRRWSSSVASLMPSVFGGSSSSSATSPPLPAASARSRSFTTPSPATQHRDGSASSTSSGSGSPSPTHPTRPLKLLLYSADGYTESSLAALCLLMSVKGLTLPEAYLDLQVGKRRSFFVYAHDLGVLRRVESRLIEERERERDRVQRERERQETVERMLREARERETRERAAHEERMARSDGEEAGIMLNANGKRTIGSVHGSGRVPEKGPGGGLSLFKVFEGAPTAAPPRSANSTSIPPSPPPSVGAKSQHAFTGRPAAKSVSFSQAPTWGQRSQLPQTPSSWSHAPSSTVRVPPTIPQGIPIPPSSGHIALPPPEEFTGSLPALTSGTMQHPRKAATLPLEPRAITPGHQRLAGVKRPRANTSPWLPSFFGGDHQSWFNDPRFDGSFPSRVLPFLYLGNLNHASNVYMLHALGITHVVSVGECALLPPPHHMVGHSPGGGNLSLASPACSPGRSPHHGGHGNVHARSGHGSLWTEEREGRIKVLDIKGVCDDGIDTLEPQLEPICDWIDKAREEGGQVLVHCRVGVSRSATVTIAYVMKHLSLPLVDAYLIVRSRRLSVLIQPNMRLLYNLCGWEIKLAKERAGWVEDGGAKGESPTLVEHLFGEKTKERVKLERRLERELARTLTWPYLSMEVHKLNEKYLH